MTRRKRKSGRRWWLWILGAVIGAVAVYFFVPHRGSGPEIPLPGEAAAPQGVEPPREEIHDAEREKLDRVLRERSR